MEVYDILEVLQIYAVQVSLKIYDMIADATLGQIMEHIKKEMEAGELIKRMEWDVKFHEYMIHYVSNKRLDMIFERWSTEKEI